MPNAEAGTGQETGHDGAYTHGYDSGFTLVQHAARTAEKQAAFLLPHLRPGMSLLDCGCGSGSITVGLARAVAPGQTVGVDISPMEIERAQAKAASLGITDVHFLVGSIYALDFASSSLDVVFSHNVLEHLADPSRALAEMRRLLKPGGIIAIRDYDIGGVLAHIPERADIPERLLIDWLALLGKDWQRVSGDPRFARRLPQVLSTAGFVDLDVSASYDVFAGEAARVMFVDVVAARCREREFVQRVVDGGLASREQLEAMHDAWLAVAEDPLAWAALSPVEVIAKKV